MIRALFELSWWFADRAWRFARAWSGDDAYERYLADRIRTGAEDHALSREAFFSMHIEERWRRHGACGRTGEPR